MKKLIVVVTDDNAGAAVAAVSPYAHELHLDPIPMVMAEPAPGRLNAEPLKLVHPLADPAMRRDIIEAEALPEVRKIRRCKRLPNGRKCRDVILEMLPTNRTLIAREFKRLGIVADSTPSATIANMKRSGLIVEPKRGRIEKAVAE
jgi:hypothetical protein